MIAMKKNSVFILMIILFGACKKEKNDAPAATIVSVNGDIETGMNEFRNLLGATLNTTPGHTSGRREINWDGVPDIYTTEKIPSDFFNPVAAGSNPSLQRGFHYTAATDGRISNNNFAGFDSTNASEFAAFSGSKTFSAISNNEWNVDFQVPEQSAAAAVKGFGAVFSDVDVAGSASIEFFSGNRSLGIYQVPAGNSGSFSFLGVYFPNEKITGVRIKQGDAVIAPGVKDISAGGNKDLVAMDDFLYDEPQAF